MADKPQWFVVYMLWSVLSLKITSLTITFFIIISLTITSSVSSLEITSLSIPSYSKQGENVTFHCKYTVNKSQLAELDIKWYLGSSPSPFLVYLPYLQQEPQVVDHRFRQKIVFMEEKVGSGFVMKNMSSDLSGVYTCKVSTNTMERISRKRIKIYSKLTLIT